MSTFMHSTLARWRVMHRRRRQDRELREALRRFDDRLLEDAGLKRPHSTDYPWL